MRRILLALPLLLGGCAALTEWANTPVDDPTSTPIPGGGSVVVNPPPPQDPVTIELPGGGSAVVTPPGAAPPKTRGEVVAGVIGGAAGAATGNPLIGVGVVTALMALLGLRKKQ